MAEKAEMVEMVEMAEMVEWGMVVEVEEALSLLLEAEALGERDGRAAEVAPPVEPETPQEVEGYLFIAEDLAAPGD